ncbi:Short C-terminal domain-containing protein [Nocardioides alpinus]|uniref:Short C-terminal domain-containing protein n=1 Tax=Nocardioides alpinus TaxID=748909 RepID=A0A1I1AWB4_9ACTN|nr:SHOCT domain-containing protein [Nocardioides alpinus]PKH40957.1 hypothetical protein CXG46_10905 [Nocardioides alpinus]SFB42389.1 Short C-terminal domain-containing protein [Nocardioides alpinus]
MDNYPLLSLVFTMIWFFLFIAWLFLLINLTGDILRSDDLSGWGKAGWIFLLILLPLLTALVYIGVRGDGMRKRQVADVRAREDALRAHFGGPSTADDLTKLAALRDSGVLSEEEFAAQKAKLLAV